MSSKEPSKEHTNLTTDGKKQSSVNDDYFTDSGILSGPNLSCEQYDGAEKTMNFKELRSELRHTDSRDVRKQSSANDDCFNTDSGFLSGQDLSCEQYDSVEKNIDFEAEKRNVSFNENKKNLDKERNFAADSGLIVAEDSDSMGLDSGIVDGILTNSLSNLKLENKSQDASVAKNIPFVYVNNCDDTEDSDLPQWQLYFQQEESEGDTQLHLAIIQGYTEAVWALLKICPHPSLLDIRNDIAQTPLHLAVLTGQPQVVRRLVLAGAKVSSRNSDGNTPLHLATAAADTECLLALVSSLSPSERAHLPQTLDQKNYDGETCIHLAAIRGHIDVLDMLVCYGADIKAREGKAGRTALHMAVQRNDLVMVTYLINKCQTMQTVRSYAGYTAKRFAPPTLFDMLSGSESDNDDSEDDDEDIFSSDEEMQLEDTNIFSRNINGMGSMNVAY